MNSDGLQDIVSMDVMRLSADLFQQGHASGSEVYHRRTRRHLPLAIRRGGFSRHLGPNSLRPPRPPRLCHQPERPRPQGSPRRATTWGKSSSIPNAAPLKSPISVSPCNSLGAEIPTAKDRNQRWGNVFAPCTWDWDRDGKEDLIIGEGSYSANNIHLLLNQGSPTHAVFDDTNRFVIAYGDGREQLSPAVADYNGDGIPDILVCDRSGQVAVHLGKAWKKEAPELPFKELIPNLSAGNPATIAVGDMNGDGLFDLVFGKADGRIAMSPNTGSKTEPKFGSPEDIRRRPRLADLSFSPRIGR